MDDGWEDGSWIMDNKEQITNNFLDHGKASVANRFSHLLGFSCFNFLYFEYPPWSLPCPAFFVVLIFDLIISLSQLRVSFLGVLVGLLFPSSPSSILNNVPLLHTSRDNVSKMENLGVTINRHGRAWHPA